MTGRKEDPLVTRYRNEMGCDPPEPTGPLAEQWDYRGTKAERAELEADLYAQPPVEVGDDQEPLF